MGTIYKTNFDNEESQVIEQMRLKLAKEFGVTVQGNRVTVRWGNGHTMYDCSMIIDNVTTNSDRVEEAKKLERRNAELARLYKKYPGLKSELAEAEFYAEFGEHPQ